MCFLHNTHNNSKIVENANDVIIMVLCKCYKRFLLKSIKKNINPYWNVFS